MEQIMARKKRNVKNILSVNSTRQWRLVNDIFRAIKTDDWMWLVIWGKNRLGKSNLAMWLSYFIYKDWNKVLDSVFFTLEQFDYKLDHNIPELWPTEQGFNRRIPLLIWDDMGVHGNKAATQHKEAWDHFKGEFQSLGAEIGVLIGTMLQPTSITLQLEQKYTHEVFIKYKGVYKYDEVDWLQRYGGTRGFEAAVNKDWIETVAFTPVPRFVYAEYNKMRKALSKEARMERQEVMTEEKAPRILKRLKPLDIEILKEIERKGSLSYAALKKNVGEGFQDAASRLKSRGLIVPVRKKSYYAYDLTNLGLEILQQSSVEEKMALRSLWPASHPKP